MRRRKAAAAVVLLGLLTAPLAAQQHPAQLEPVKWSIALALDARPRTSESFDVLVTAAIEPGWYVYAMSQVPDGPVPLTIALPNGQPFSVAGAIEEPRAKRRIDPNFDDRETRYFERALTIAVPVRVARGTSPGRHSLKVSVEFQACSASLCLRPKRVELAIAVNVEDRL